MYYINELRQSITIPQWLPYVAFLSALVFFVGFLFYWNKEPRSLKNGLLFNLSIFSLFTSILTFGQLTPTQIWKIFSYLSIFAIIVMILIGIYAGLVLFIWNAAILVKKNASGDASWIVSGIGIAFLVYLIAFLLGSNLPGWLGVLLSILPLTIVYVAFIFFDFLTLSIFDNLRVKKFDYDYLVVLGAGLINGEQVSPTLGARLQQALQIANQQFALTHLYPKIIVTGGKNGSSKISEANAMKKWLVAEHYPTNHVIKEEQAKNTFDNMHFSKVIIEKNSDANKQPKVAFVTNSYHVVRSGIYARRANFNALGIGAKTPGYFVPAGWLREFAAIFVMKKRQHFIAISLISFIVVIGTLLFISEYGLS